MGWMDGWMDGVNSKKVHAERVRLFFFSWIISSLDMGEALPIDGCNGCHTSGEVETWNWDDGLLVNASRHYHFHLIMSAYHDI
jgi:hypothetical protein